MSEKITISCPGCSGQLSVPSSLIGRRAKCPKCCEVFAAGYKPPVASTTPMIFRCESCLQEFDSQFDGEFCAECTSIIELAERNGVREALRRPEVDLSLDPDESGTEGEANDHGEFPPTTATKEYKVLTQKDKWFSEIGRTHV